MNVVIQHRNILFAKILFIKGIEVGKGKGKGKGKGGSKSK